MKNFILFSFIFLISAVSAQKKTNIAVLELDATGISPNEAKVLSDRLRTELFNTDKFTVLERDKMNEILNEQGFQMSGCTSNECVVEAGKLIGVNKMVAGNIAKITDMFTLNIRLIDVESGKVLKTATEDCDCSLKEVLTISLKNVSADLAGIKIETATSKIKMYQTKENLPNNIRSNAEYKSPLLSFAGSFLLPGIALGQYYNGDYIKGFTINILAIGGFITSGMEIGGSDDHIKVTIPIVGISYLFSIIDAPVSSNIKNKKLQKRYGHLIELNDANQVVGFDIETSNNEMTGKLTIHF